MVNRSLVAELLICREVHPLLAVIPGVLRFWPYPDTVQRIEPWFIGNMDVQGVVLTRRWASINQAIGGACGPISCVYIPFAGCVVTEVSTLLPRLLITSSRSRMVGLGLKQRTCKHCACPATTEKPPKRRHAVTEGGRGAKSLRLASKDACACPNFCACKLK